MRRCEGCVARDNHIASLKQEMHELREYCNRELQVRHDDLHDIVKHITGMNRIVPTQPSGQLHSVPRNTGIQGRVARAEAADRRDAEPLAAQRKKEYDDRIRELIPETEIKEDASS